AQEKQSVSSDSTSTFDGPRPASYAGSGNQSPVKDLYWAAVSGTTERRPMRTRGESVNSLLDLISPSETGRVSAFPALILTTGFWGLEESTETTEAVPTADLCSPVS